MGLARASAILRRRGMTATVTRDTLKGTDSMTIIPAEGEDARQEPFIWGLGQIVTDLHLSREILNRTRKRPHQRELPSRAALEHILDGLCAALFPTHFGSCDFTDESVDYFVGNTLNHTLNALVDQVRRGLLLQTDGEEGGEAPGTAHAYAVTKAFADRLPEIRTLLTTDLRAAYQGDPAATSISEILLCYPGMTAIILYRLAHALYALGSRLLARLVSGIAHSRTGIDIHPGAQIGESFFIDHGTGVVIGETAIIGKHVRLYQAVTLGAKRFPTDDSGTLIKGMARHPILEDNVVVYAGATILGRITVGADSTIGGNVWLTNSVPPGSNISQAQTRNG